MRFNEKETCLVFISILNKYLGCESPHSRPLFCSHAPRLGRGEGTGTQKKGTLATGPQVSESKLLNDNLSKKMLN